jgi:acetylornithine/N-succinyldiaminopimelate aminotransferase
MVEGAGSWLRDSEGREYLDFVQGWAVNCLGHSHPVVVEALRAQAGKLINCSPAYYNERMARLAGLVSQATGVDQVFLCNSGAEANEGAIKLARKWGQRFRGGAYEIVTTQGAFHGRTLATMSASGKPAFEPLFEPKVPGFRKVPLNDLAAMDAAITERTVAVMLEPIQGEAGVIPADDDYLIALRALTRERGVLLILDEIQTGVGRTGRFCAYEHVGVQPDILTLGKGLGAGVPLAALVAGSDVCCFEPGDQGGTFNGNPLMCAAGLAVLERVAAPDFLKSAVDAGLFLASELQRLSARHGLGEVRGRGLLLALDLKHPIGASIVAQALENGVLLNSPQPDALRFMPALNVTREEIAAMIESLDAILTKMGAARRVA